MPHLQYPVGKENQEGEEMLEGTLNINVNLTLAPETQELIRLLLGQMTIPDDEPVIRTVVQTESPKRRTRRAKEAPETVVVQQTEADLERIEEEAAAEKAEAEQAEETTPAEPPKEPEIPKEIDATTLRGLLSRIAVLPESTVERSKDIVERVTGNRNAKVLDLDRALYPRLYQACMEVLDAA